MAPLNTKSVPLRIVPVSLGAAAPGLTLYQRTTLRPPVPSTVC
jgi:hypothetical protein